MTAQTNHWTDDKLGRESSAIFLTNYLSKRYALGKHQQNARTFVLNIRADWGFGKTFFLNNWRKDLERSNYPVVYFDAWANDFTEDPLISFISEINQALEPHYKQVPQAEKIIREAVNASRKLLKPLGVGIASVITKQLTGYTVQQFIDATTSDSEGIETEVSKTIDLCADFALTEHVEKKRAIQNFKAKLESLIEALNADGTIELPLYIFIDELDRCRPTYAIELLETVKHLFGVPGIYFVVATNVAQLGHSVKSIYGEQFDSERYLKRFFDQEYMLPTPDNLKFSGYLFERLSLEKIVKQQLYTTLDEQVYPGIKLPELLFSIFSDRFGLSLRDQEQVASTLQAILLNWQESGTKIHLAYLMLLVVAKQTSSPLFSQLIGTGKMELAEFSAELEKAYKHSKCFVRKRNNREYDSPVRTPDEYDFDKIVWTYHVASKYSYHDISAKLQNDRLNLYEYPDKIYLSLNEEYNGKTFRSGYEPVLSIANYAERVKQVGQFTSL